MPIYEYQCDACGELLEALQKISDPPLTDCPACGRASLRKKVSAVAFRLKGSGWYETDFKSGNKKNLAGEQEGGKGAGKDDAGAKDSSSEKSGSDAGSSSKSDKKSGGGSTAGGAGSKSSAGGSAA